MRRLSRPAPLFLAAAFALTSPVAPAVAQTISADGRTQDEASPPAGLRVPVEPAADDASIAERLTRIFVSTGWFEAPQVAVRDGVAFLDGTADSQAHRDWAADLAGRTDGVLAVVDNIEVAADAGSTFGRAGEAITAFYDDAVRSWPLVLVAILILAVTWAAARAVTWLARRFVASRVASPLLAGVLVRAATVPVILLGLYFVLQVAGLTSLAVTVLGGTGLLGIIIGFAFRDIAENFLASLLLSVRNPFRSGDLVDIEGHVGIVQNLNTRTTILLTLDGNHVQIPNATVFKSIIKNYSSIPSRRAEFLVGIGYDSSAAKAQALISEVLRDHPAVLDQPEPLVLVDTLGDATVNLRVFYWFDSGTYSPAKTNSALLRLTKNILLENGIELPDPAREIVFPKGVPLTRMAERPAMAPRVGATAPAAAIGDADARVTTTGEGDLSSESRDVDERAAGSVPEAEENLLKA